MKRNPRIALARPPAHGGDTRAVRERFGLDFGASVLVDFSVSINPLGPPGGVVETLRRAAQFAVEYPEPHARTLRSRLARLHGVADPEVLAGNGSSELIYLIALALPSRRSVILDPTYSDYARASRAARLSIAHSLDRHDEPSPRPIRSGDLVWLGNPNNPTGAGWERSTLLDWIDAHARATFVVDEAFLPFWEVESKRSLASIAPTRPNLIVLRSMTKFYAMPGLRLGYLVAHEQIVRRVRRQQPPWSVNAVAIAAGEAALDDLTYAERTRSLVAASRDAMFHSLSRVPDVEVFPSVANFLLVRSLRPGWPAARLQERLARRGFLIRDASNFRGLDASHFRVAVLRPEQNDALVGALAEILQGES